MISLETLRTLVSGRLGTALLVAVMAVASVLLIPQLEPGSSEVDAHPVVSVTADGASGHTPEG